MPIRTYLCVSAIAAVVVSGALAVAPAAAQSTRTASGTAGSSPTDGPRKDYRSQHFYVHSDISPADAKELLERLEYMLALIAQYWQKPPQGLIEMYVVKDLKNWPPGTLPDEEGRYSIQSGGGVTLSRVLGNSGKSTVYAGADRGTPQHEAVHAYCHQNFGTSGPTWYSEGMAEMGQYWRKNDLTVNVHDVVIAYIRRSTPKSLNEIVNGNERTGDSWQNYAWRWALCHLLANNTNYAARFRPLGLGILSKRPDATFERAYGDMANEISFEYLFFLSHVCNGYRVDLCSWDWKRKFLAMAPGNSRVIQVAANRGYQPSGVLVKPDQTYEISCEGLWKTDPKHTKPLTADGDGTGEGKLVGVVFKDFELSDEFEIGARGKFTPPSEGQLHLRCKCDWGSIADNTGKVTVKIAVNK